MQDKDQAGSAREEFDRTLIAHWIRYGVGGLIRKTKSGWWVSWRDQGFPSPYRTKREAYLVAEKWVALRREDMDEKAAQS